jgi:hypothetical protein
VDDLSLYGVLMGTIVDCQGQEVALDVYFAVRDISDVL